MTSKKKASRENSLEAFLDSLDGIFFEADSYAAYPVFEIQEYEFAEGLKKTHPVLLGTDTRAVALVARLAANTLMNFHLQDKGRDDDELSW